MARCSPATAARESRARAEGRRCGERPTPRRRPTAVSSSITRPTAASTSLDAGTTGAVTLRLSGGVRPSAHAPVGVQDPNATRQHARRLLLPSAVWHKSAQTNSDASSPAPRGGAAAGEALPRLGILPRAWPRASYTRGFAGPTRPSSRDVDTTRGRDCAWGMGASGWRRLRSMACPDSGTGHAAPYEGVSRPLPPRALRVPGVLRAAEARVDARGADTVRVATSGTR